MGVFFRPTNSPKGLGFRGFEGLGFFKSSVFGAANFSGKLSLVVLLLVIYGADLR